MVPLWFPYLLYDYLIFIIEHSTAGQAVCYGHHAEERGAQRPDLLPAPDTRGGPRQYRQGKNSQGMSKNQEIKRGYCVSPKKSKVNQMHSADIASS